MHSALWFITDGVRILSVLENEKSADQELSKYKDDPDFNFYDYYGILIDDLEDYPEEYDMALSEGLLL